MRGEEGDDTLSGNQGNDIIKGNTGRDALDGNDGNDTLDGGDQRDVLDGGWGDDTLQGGGGDDHLTGAGGADLVQGDVGDDLLFGGRGADTLEGGAGDDTLYGADFLNREVTLDDLSTLQDNGNDLSGISDLEIKLDDDTSGMDVLVGGDGDDLLNIGMNDTATGGSGDDDFALHSEHFDGTNQAVITDLETGANAEEIVIFYDASVTTPTVTTVQNDSHTTIALNGFDAVIVENTIAADVLAAISLVARP